MSQFCGKSISRAQEKAFKQLNLQVISSMECGLVFLIEFLRIVRLHQYELIEHLLLNNRYYCLNVFCYIAFRHIRKFLINRVGGRNQPLDEMNHVISWLIAYLIGQFWVHSIGKCPSNQMIPNIPKMVEFARIYGQLCRNFRDSRGACL